MDPDRLLQFALKKLADARRELERGESVTGTCDHISTAMYWAMEYWVSGQGHQPDFGNGWHSLHIQFVELTEGMAVNALSRCVHEAASLDLRLRGWPKPLDWDTWRHDVAECIETAERLLGTLPPLPEFPREFHFYLGGYGGPHHEIRWECHQLHYVNSSMGPGMGYPVSSMLLVDEWQHFWDSMDRMEVWNWPRRCTGNEGVCDGTQWKFKIGHGDRAVHSAGSNAYPFTADIEPPLAFRAFVDAVSRLVGRPSFL